MSDSRYDELVCSLLEGDLASEDVDKLAALIRAEPKLRRDLRHQLVLWELWAQHHTPERTADAFFNAMRTRLRAEREDASVSFLASVKHRLVPPFGAEPQATSAPHWRRFIIQPATWAWAASIALTLTFCLIWLATPRKADAKTVRGEAVCTACMLHETEAHLPAILVHEGAATRVVHVQEDASVSTRLGNFCAAPVPVELTGTTRSENGREILSVHTVHVLVAQPMVQEPVLFPF